MDAAHITEIIIITLLSLIGFIGIRIFASIDKLFTKVDDLDKSFNSKCDAVTGRINDHALKIQECDYKHR